MNFVRDDDFPHRTPFGFLVDSGQYGKCLQVGLDAIGYQDFLREQEAARRKGRLLGIGISTMTEPLGAGNSREYDILGIKMFDSAELRVHLTGKAILRTGAKTQGQGHETTWAQIIADALGVPIGLSGEREASARGAALLTLQALGADIPPPEDPVRILRPDPGRHARYREARRRQSRLYDKIVGFPDS